MPSLAPCGGVAWSGIMSMWVFSGFHQCLTGFNLFKTFFENVNLSDHRLKRQGTQLVWDSLLVLSKIDRENPALMSSLANIYIYIYNWFSQCVERLDLAGMDFIWRIAMESPDEDIANEAIQLIITYSYINLNPKMKKVRNPDFSVISAHSFSIILC